MGTRSTVKFYDEYSKGLILSVYQQYDGYITGVGHDLAAFLNSKSIINGISGQTKLEHANGLGCLAAQYVAEKKTKIGNFYMTTASDLQEYNYEVRLIDGKIVIKVDDFEGSPDELLKQKDW